MLAVSLTGGVLGALLLLLTPGATFEHLVPWLLLFGIATFAFGKRGSVILSATSRSARGRWWCSSSCWASTAATSAVRSGS